MYVLCVIGLELQSRYGLTVGQSPVWKSRFQYGLVKPTLRIRSLTCIRPILLIITISPTTGYREISLHSRSQKSNQMKILAIETASPPGSIALLDARELVLLSRLKSPNRTTQELAPMIRDQLKAAGWLPTDIKIVAVNDGPGSFTGLRIGVTAAKVFAYSVSGQVVGINTLKTIASQCPTTDRPIEAIMDAQRNQLFAARFRKIGDELQMLYPTCIIDAKEWLQTRASDATVVGTGLMRLREKLPPGIDVVDERHWAPRADSLGLLAHVAAERGDCIQPMELTPQYFRKSAAEEKLGGP